MATNDNDLFDSSYMNDTNKMLAQLPVAPGGSATIRRETAAPNAPWANDPTFKQGEALVASETPNLVNRTRQAISANDDEAAYLDKNRPPAPPDMKQDAPKFSDFAKQTSPLLMILTAVGGKAAGLSGQNMLGAMTGMVEGTQAGNEEAFQKAHDAWTENYQLTLDEWKRRSDYYNQVEGWYKGRVDAKQRAAQMSGELIGIGEQMMQKPIQNYMAHEKLMVELKKANDKSTQLKGLVEARLLKVGGEMAGKAETATARIEKLDLVDQMLDEAATRVRRLIDKKKAEFDVYSPENWRHYFETAASKNDPDVARLLALQGNIKGTMTFLKIPPGQRATVFLERLEQGGLPELFSQSLETFEQQVNINKDWVKQAKTEAQRGASTYSDIAHRALGPNVAGLDGGSASGDSGAPMSLEDYLKSHGG